jgi:hypothetical protein
MTERQLQRHLDKPVVEEDAEEPEPVVQHQLAEQMPVQQVLHDLSKTRALKTPGRYMLSTPQDESFHGKPS